eukprot:CAMPEP_0195288780 /NCGR_PEP_ID=MMETSP0707-20130614/5306_1 /TAXON_ID=33640 /ORGANISM="Asterionellopsis glacialis, Strain CCMP134" /LENGTH=1258 /DNA_ID=CAMNT_0040348683 /DNA_START=1066 /DNA_END=4842 /DNA_ORIENTATION=-
MVLLRPTIILLLSLLLLQLVQAQNGIVREAGFQFSTVLETGINRPTDMAFLPDGRLLVTEREGGVFLFDANLQRIGEAMDLTSVVCNNCAERGLISMLLHPNFDQNGFVYLYWVHHNTDNGSCECDIANNIAAPLNRLSRFTMTGNTIDRNSEYIMFETSPVGSMHNGGGMAFGDDGFLYIATGDGKYPANANSPSQHTNNLLGKVLRITDDGLPAPGNPYLGEPNSIRCNTRRLVFEGGQDTKCQEVYHLGFRNPFGLAKDPTVPQHMRMMIGDVGSETWEDISVAESGAGLPVKNFGWPHYEGPCRENTRNGQNCAVEDQYEQPLHFYDRPGPEGQTGAAITAGCFVPPGVWPSQYDGAYFYADLRRGRIYHMKYDPNRGCRGPQCAQQISQYEPVEIVVDENPTRTHPLGSPLRLRFGVGEDSSSMFMLTYNTGVLYKLRNTEDPNRGPTAVIADLVYGIDAATGGMTVKFDGSESVDPDGHSMTFLWEFGEEGSPPATGAVVSHTYSQKGKYTATLTVEDERGSKSIQTVDIDTRNDLQPLETFEWNYGDDCPPGYDACGALEFCQNIFTRTISYAYRTPSCQTNPCLPGRSPVIRLQRGLKYKLTLINAVAGQGLAPTNLHTHGLHIDGAGDADNVMREAYSGECLDYTWDIPADHPPGTYWYHSHHHESSLTQVGGGAYGLLIVDEDKPLRGNNPTPSWAYNELLLQVSVDNSNKVMANGAHYEIFSIEALEWYRLRISIVDSIAIHRDLEFTEGCEVYRVASDGVWHSYIPGYETSNSYKMTGASRGDFAIRCPTPQSSMNIRWHGTVVAIVDIGAVAPNPHEMKPWVPARPDSLSGIASADVPEANKFGITIQRATLNGLAWDPVTPLRTLHYNQVHEWTIGDSRNHPFHTHLYHMMVVTPGGCGPHLEGEFYDTISGPECTVRFKTADIGERMVMHCHVMQHSDSGAMAWVAVDSGAASPMPRNLGNPNSHVCSTHEMLSCPPEAARTLPPVNRDEIFMLFTKNDEVLGGQSVSSTPPGYTYRQYTDGRAVILLGEVVVWEKIPEIQIGEGEWMSKLQGDCNFLIRKDGVSQWNAQSRFLDSNNCFVGIYLGNDDELKLGVLEGDIDNPGATVWEETVLEHVTLSPTISPSNAPTSSPSASPTTQPTSSPSARPSSSPSFRPSARPTTMQPSDATEVPTIEPTNVGQEPSKSSPTRPLDTLDLTADFGSLNDMDLDLGVRNDESSARTTTMLYISMTLSFFLGTFFMYC